MTEVEKYKALYENEKSHNETLTLIINKLVELLEPSKRDIIKPLLEKGNDFFGNPPYKFTCEPTVPPFTQEVGERL